MYNLLQTDSAEPLVSLAEPPEWNTRPRYVLSAAAVTSRSAKPDVVEASTGQPQRHDDAARKKSIKAALRRLRAVARKKPIGTVDEFIAARRAAASEG